MKCKHEKTKKLFWLNQQRGKWEKTNFSICQGCGSCVGMQPIKIEQKDMEKSLKEKTHDIFSEGGKNV